MRPCAHLQVQLLRVGREPHIFDHRPGVPGNELPGRQSAVVLRHRGDDLHALFGIDSAARRSAGQALGSKGGQRGQGGALLPGDRDSSSCKQSG